MSPQYLENPILLVNSNGPVAASGRNVRARFRTQQAAKRTRSEGQNGQFGVFEVNPGTTSTTAADVYPVRKRSKCPDQATEFDSNIIAQWPKKAVRDQSVIRKPKHGPKSVLVHSTLKPSEVLAYATFHIRLLASMAVLTNPDHLSQVLLCRQWSCISLPADRIGKSDVLDSSLECVAAKVCQLNGTAPGSLDDLLIYEEALLRLQDALQHPKQHEVVDLRTSIQLLAMYEMLRSLDNPSWVQHISGAKLLCQPQTMLLNMETSSNTFSYALTIPIAAEALLTGDDKFFEDRPWRNLLRSACNGYGSWYQSSIGLATCMIDLPMLISDVKTAFKSSTNLDSESRDSLRDRAKLLRSRVRFDVLNEDAYVHDRGTRFGAFDELGVCLAGLIALDRILASLQEDEVSELKLIEDKTQKFCAQMLHLDLGAGGAYAASDLMEAFQMSPFRQQAAFIVVLPGRSGKRANLWY